MPLSVANSIGTSYTSIVAPTRGILRYVPFVVNCVPIERKTLLSRWNWRLAIRPRTPHLSRGKKKTQELCPVSGGNPCLVIPLGLASRPMIPTTRTIVAVRQVSARKACLVSCTSDELQALRPLRLMFSIRNPPNAAMGSTTSLSSMMPAIAANVNRYARFPPHLLTRFVRVPTWPQCGSTSQ